MVITGNNVLMVKFGFEEFENSLRNYSLRNYSLNYFQINIRNISDIRTAEKYKNGTILQGCLNFQVSIADTPLCNLSI